MQWPSSSVPSSDGEYCSHRFPELWSSFVHAIVDTLHAGGPTITRPSHTVAPAACPTVFPPAERLIAIGDLHGDLQKARRAFRLAGLVNEQDIWTGGSTVAVQVGDILDRGDQEIEIFYWLERLQREARASGGDLHILNGNHETMNVAQSFRYATPGGFTAFRQWAKAHALEIALKARCGCHAASDLIHMMRALDKTKKSGSRNSSDDGVSARSLALQPGGPFALRFLADHPVVLQVGSTVFVHGGLLPQHVEYGIDRINLETREWISYGPMGAKPHFLSGRTAVVWSREYSLEDSSRCDCDALELALRGVPGAKRMVVGHTIQETGINSACSGKVIRVDVGLSKGCGNGLPEVLEILNDAKVRRLREAVAPQNTAAATPRRETPNDS